MVFISAKAVVKLPIVVLLQKNAFVLHQLGFIQGKRYSTRVGAMYFFIEGKYNTVFSQLFQFSKFFSMEYFCLSAASTNSCSIPIFLK